LTDGFEERRVGFDVFMARHADIGRWNTGVWGLIDRSVTIPAVKSELTGMKLMIVGNRLSRLVANPSVLGSSIVGYPGNYCPSGHAQSDNQLDWYGVDPARKNITHEIFVV
jgi:hypothetical protein